eukprot:6187895-Pleurochrysis_carterae.AAC.1
MKFALYNDKHVSTAEISSNLCNEVCEHRLADGCEPAMRRIEQRRARTKPTTPVAHATPSSDGRLHPPFDEHNTRSAASGQASGSIDSLESRVTLERTPAVSASLDVALEGSTADISSIGAAAAGSSSSLAAPRRRPPSTRPRRSSAYSSSLQSFPSLTLSDRNDDASASAAGPQAMVVRGLMDNVADLERELASARAKCVQAEIETAHYQGLMRQTTKMYGHWKKKAEGFEKEMKLMSARLNAGAGESTQPAAAVQVTLASQPPMLLLAAAAVEQHLHMQAEVPAECSASNTAHQPGVISGQTVSSAPPVAGSPLPTMQ